MIDFLDSCFKTLMGDMNMEKPYTEEDIFCVWSNSTDGVAGRGMFGSVLDDKYYEVAKHNADTTSVVEYIIDRKEVVKLSDEIYDLMCKGGVKDFVSECKKQIDELKVEMDSYVSLKCYSKTLGHKKAIMEYTHNLIPHIIEFTFNGTVGEVYVDIYKNIIIEDK